ncbi:hypothetical protein A5625_13160 [Mycobacterium sp. 1465703.0]|nr:hypothetical protein [Mycobacterium sp. 1465703.0]OBJ09416.1 hypothetical protein A5625_13160 [Mycobacterium sp. 1465703.0]
MARVKKIAVQYAAVSLGFRPAVDRALHQMLSGAALNKQGNEVAQFALFKPLILALDYASNVVAWDFRKLLGKATLHRIDLRPLFLRHAHYFRHRTSV